MDKNKYVAYIDVLGFSDQIASKTHNEAKELIIKFSSEIYALWKEQNLHNDKFVNARVFSDMLVVHTIDSSHHSLDKIISFLSKLFRISAIEHGLLLRGGLAFGEFDDLPVTEFHNLSKGLVVGKAFLDAYNLESQYEIKGSKLIFGFDLKCQIDALKSNYRTKRCKRLRRGGELYELKWADLGYLTRGNFDALDAFVDLATNGKWRDHYYLTLEMFLSGARQTDKYQIYLRILDRLRAEYKYTEIDRFIEQFFKAEGEGMSNLKRSFSSYLRDRIFSTN